MQRLPLAILARPLLQLPRPWMVALLMALVLATPGQSQLRLFDRRDEELALRSELSVLTSQLGAVEQVLSELLQSSTQPENLLNVLDQLNQQDGFVLSATITALQLRLNNAEGVLGEEEIANLRLAYEEAQRRYVRVQSLRSRIARQMADQSPAQSQTAQQNNEQAPDGDGIGSETVNGDGANTQALQRLQEEARRLASQLDRSQEQLKSAQSEAMAAQQALAKRAGEAAQLDLALRQTQRELEDSQSNAGELGQALRTLETERQRLEEQVTQSKAQAAAAEQALQQVTTQQQEQALMLASVLERAEQAETALERAQDALQQDDGQARQTLLDRENEIARLQDSLTALNQNLSDQQDQLSALQQERSALQQAVAERDQALVGARLAQAEIRDAVKAQVADQKAAIDRLKLALSERDAELALTATALASKQEALTTTLQRIEQLDGQAEGLVTSLAEREAELARAQSQANAAMARQTELERALAAAERRASSLETQVARLQNDAQGHSQQLADRDAAVKQALTLADQRQRALETPRLALPQQVAWSFEAHYGSLGHRLSAAQRRDLRKALDSKPAGGCLLVSASADPRPIKPGYSIRTNSELASLRALSMLRALQALDKTAAENALLLGLSAFQHPELTASSQRSARLVWLDQPCSDIIQSAPLGPTPLAEPTLGS